MMEEDAKFFVKEAETHPTLGMLRNACVDSLYSEYQGVLTHIPSAANW